jgi:hypothetical protein
MLIKTVYLIVSLVRMILAVILTVGILFLGFFLLLMLLEFELEKPTPISTESILKNTTYQPFFAGLIQIKSVSQRNRNQIEVVFKTTLKPADSYFSVIHDLAKQSNWELVEASQDKRIYDYPAVFPEYPEYLRSRTTLLYRANYSEVIILVENNYQEEQYLVPSLFIILFLLGLLILYLTKLQAKLRQYSQR